jgi:hypothetical protein
MAAHPFGAGAAGWPRVREVLSIFEQMGCEIKLLPGTLLDPDGTPTMVRFLYNPVNGAGVALLDYDDDDEFMTPSEIENLERRLDLPIPKPDSWRPLS